MIFVSLTEWVTQISTGKTLGSFPTDTVPALAARPDQGDRIYAAKGRSPDKPLILMGACLADLLPYVQGTADELAQWQQVTDRHWPGALTLVLPGSDRLPPAMNPQQTGTLGIRVPDHPLARHLLAQTGPLATTSVNRSGQPALVERAAIAQQFPELLQLDDSTLASLEQTLGPFPIHGSGQPSTVVQWQNTGWQILRQGAVAIDTLPMMK
ncbi:MAG: L-threonylcarbamoyladenylate synthase [Cyanobacteria bacterium]|nr:L-threonylcarbamoyladenylate synthase [Cyanobacteriota bacterium]MDA0864900.1 L-threonylcarbamoyladenylate synthase [Cyanobacteriota bacterium]